MKNEIKEIWLTKKYFIIKIMDALLTKSNNKHITYKKKSNIDYKVFLSLRHFVHNYITATLVWQLKKYIFLKWFMYFKS